MQQGQLKFETRRATGRWLNHKKIRRNGRFEIYVPDHKDIPEAPDRIEALELANNRARARAQAATTVAPVGARYYPPEVFEYEVVPLPGSSDALGSSLGGNHDHNG